MHSRIALLMLVFAACSGASPIAAGTDPDENQQGSQFVVCEDQCNECGDIRCPSDTRFLCQNGANNCTKPTPYACICCAEDECLVGSHTTGACVKCPSGQVCDDSANTCCTPLTPAQACNGQTCGTVSDGCDRTIDCGTCGAGQTCNGGQCCAPATCPDLEVGSACGIRSDGCGGSISCTFCGQGATCSAAGKCQCRAGYRNCGGSCWPSNRPCP